MDIQVASNFERLLLELRGRTMPTRTRGRMQGFAQGGGYRRWSAAEAAGAVRRRQRRPGARSQPTIAATLRATGELVDPHTAVGLAVAAAATARRRACRW